MKLEVNHPATPSTVAKPEAATTIGMPLIHVVRPDVYVVEKPESSFWTNQGGAFLALLGVLVTIYVKWIGDSVARKFEVKQRIYLDMADSVLESSNSVAQLVDPEIPLRNASDKFQKSMGSIVKAELVAPDELSAAITAYKDKCGTFFMSLLQKRVVAERLKLDLANTDSVIEMWKAELDPPLLELKRMFTDGVEDAERSERLNRRIDFAREKLNSLAEAKKATAGALVRTVNEMAVHFQENQKELTDLISPVLKLVRHDLKFGRFNPRAYQERQDRTLKAAHAALDSLRRDVGKEPEQDPGRK